MTDTKDLARAINALSERVGIQGAIIRRLDALLGSLTRDVCRGVLDELALKNKIFGMEAAIEQIKSNRGGDA